MRLHLGAIPDEFTPDESWRPIREPDPTLMQLLAAPIGLAAAFLIGYGWYLIFQPLPSLKFTADKAAWFGAGALLSFPILIVVHELLHAVVFPQYGLSRSTVLGFWLRHGVFYAHHSGPLSRDRFLLVYIMPFLVISLLPLGAAAAGLLPDAWLLGAAWFSIWNALLACGDLFGVALILAQIPRRALVQNKSWRTYWKPL